MISEGYCDTEDWSNYAKIYHRNKYKILNIIYIYIYIYTFEQKNLGGW